MQNLTREAFFVLAKMLAGAVLVGSSAITEDLLGSVSPAQNPGKMFHIVWSKNYWIAGESGSPTISSAAKRNIVLPEPPDFAFSVLHTSAAAAAPPIPVGLLQSRDSGGAVKRLIGLLMLALASLFFVPLALAQTQPPTASG